MLYAIIARDIPDSAELRARTRPRHLAYIKPLADAGRVIIAGPHPAIDSEEASPEGIAGSLIIAEFASLDDARSWADADPYSTEGVFDSVEVKPFIQVLP